MTVGKAQHAIFQFGKYSLAELVHRIACFHAYYRIESGGLTLSPAFADLDPTEKAIVSFYTGMAMAKLFAEKSLGVPWLMHISRYAAPWAVRYGARLDRPDLFGCDAAGDWVVAEAKGRSRVTGRLLTKIRDQKSAVSSINGVAPTFRFGSVSRTEAGRVSLRVVDPPARRRAQDLPLDAAAWLIDYYSPIVDLIEQSPSRNDDDYVFAQLPGSGIDVGLPQDTVGVVNRSRERQFGRPAPRLRRSGEQGSDARRVLADQTEESTRDVVEGLTEAAGRGRRVRDAFPDGVIVRSSRG